MKSPIPSSSLGSSELILTERGTIYHLDLHPDHLADTIITVGDPGRVPLVSRYFDRIEHRAQHREFISHTGTLGAKRITVTSTGIGPDNIDIVLNELDALANIDFASRTLKEEKRSLHIIRLGTAGSLQADVPVDSMVVTSTAIGLDNLMHFYPCNPNPDEALTLALFREHTKLTGTSIFPYVATNSAALLKYFTSGYQQGITITCPGFYGPQGRTLRIPLAYPGLIDALGSFEGLGQRILNFEMETSALYGLGALLGHHCLSISTIVANRVNKTFSANPDAAIDQMIRQSLAIIEKI